MLGYPPSLLIIIHSPSEGGKLSVGRGEGKENGLFWITNCHMTDEWNSKNI